MVVRMKLTVEQEEYSALLKLALAEERNPEGQLRYILRSALKRRGLIARSSNPKNAFQKRSRKEGRND